MADEKVVPFLFEGEHVLRVCDAEGKHWFMAADACRIVGIQNPTQAMDALDPDERAMFNIGRAGNANFVSEGGLYTLILRSRDATKAGTVAHRFRKWVTSEVLPSLRKTGAYTMAPPVDPTPEEFETIRTADDLKLRKVSVCGRFFGHRAAAQMWLTLGLERVPAMSAVLNQMDLFETETLTITRTTGGPRS